MKMILTSLTEIRKAYFFFNVKNIHEFRENLSIFTCEKLLRKLFHFYIYRHFTNSITNRERAKLLK